MYYLYIITGYAGPLDTEELSDPPQCTEPSDHEPIEVSQITR